MMNDSRRSFVYSHSPKDTRIRIVVVSWTLVGAVVIMRLFFLMNVQHEFYLALASGSREVSATLLPKRGAIFLQDSRTQETYPFAMNRDYYVVYADTRQIRDDAAAQDVAKKITEIFHYSDERIATLLVQLNKRTDPYEPIEQKVDEDTMKKLSEMHLPGIGFVSRPYRFYPEKDLGGQVVGFVNKNDAGEDRGQYGIESYWQKELAGSGGFFEGLRSGGGKWIPLAGTSFEPAKNGADLVLTIDRTLEWTACKLLRRGMEAYGAESASLVMMDPRTGAILAMCSFPGFDPNEYGRVASLGVYNNRTIFTPYEPGSVFKPITMAAALNESLITPNTAFTDSGTRDVGCRTSIHNADNKSYGPQTMTGVLENSINTGAVYVVEKLGKKKFTSYVEAFGFGVKEGIDMDKEVEGDISSLFKGKEDGLDCYSATASFGQGITVTPIQLVTAFSAIANGGMLMKPYAVDEIRYPDGRIDATIPREVRRVISPRAASLVRSMMVSTVDNGHSKPARVRGYYVGGKTGTAQIAGPGGYSEYTNHTFVGFAPVDDPKFVLLVKYEKPNLPFADYTASPVFADISKFALQYYRVPPER